uniref:Uncharacterized protein n=1 Tax=blood disease bacterium R229 TaxID=741978 RepID=G2ZRL2_9RALS|nr:hypothetical protein BDB_150250 [blood disease bacterium R229]
MDDIASERPVTKAVPDVIDQLLVVIDEGGYQQGTGGIAVRTGHGHPGWASLTRLYQE